MVSKPFSNRYDTALDGELLAFPGVLSPRGLTYICGSLNWLGVLVRENTLLDAFWLMRLSLVTFITETRR